jgi:SAM-dependent methyltransferase
MGTAPTPKRRSAEIAFEGIAPAYDEFTVDHDAERWLENVMPELERRGLSGRRLLDVACGTGKNLVPMLARGWEVLGCDISPAMVRRARAKTGARALLLVADMRNMPVFGAFDLVWALGAALNYLLSASELRATLGGMRRNLDAGGLVLFDLNTLLTYRTSFAETRVVEVEGRRMVWLGQAHGDVAPGSTCDAYFESDGPRLSDLVRAHIHRQRHFPSDEVQEAIAQAGLCCLDTFGQNGDAVLEWPLDELVHAKAVYIAGASG